MSVVTGPKDCIYYNHKTNEQFDLDSHFNAQAIKELEYDPEERVFYLLFNNYENKLGLFIVRFSEDDLNKWQFVLRVKNKLEIDDCNICVMRDDD